MSRRLLAAVIVASMVLLVLAPGAAQAGKLRDQLQGRARRAVVAFGNAHYLPMADKQVVLGKVSFLGRANGQVQLSTEAFITANIDGRRVFLRGGDVKAAVKHSQVTSARIDFMAPMYFPGGH